MKYFIRLILSFVFILQLVNGSTTYLAAENNFLKRGSEQLTQSALAYFDQGVISYNEKNFSAAYENFRLSLAILLIVRELNSASLGIQGFIYLAKGFMYLNSGQQEKSLIQSNSSNYVVLAQLRKAYYPYLLAQYYFQKSLDFFSDVNYANLARSYKKITDENIDLVKKYLPQVDRQSRNFMKVIEAQAKCVFNYDLINAMFYAGDFNSFLSVIEENKKLVKQLQLYKSKNVNGFVQLNQAYLDLSAFLSYADKEKEWLESNKAFLQTKLNNCTQSISLAQAGFVSSSLRQFCSDLYNVVNVTKYILQQKTGIVF